MATAPATPGGTSSSSNPLPRWGRSGDPGSAFGGLGRGRGRGRGSAIASRGGRGGSSNKDPKPDDNRNPKTNAGPSPSPSTKPALPPPVFSSDKPSVPSPSVRPKPASRRTSRTIPPAITTQLNDAVETGSAPTSARPSHRRRRSQQGKASGNVPPKIDPPPPNDNLVRSNKPRLGPVPHTAPIKDTPPHLSNKLSMRNDIDALVERVRAVAMLDNRPSTPRSHIDWAGDDDDSLPDLDDWGVTTSLGGNKSGAISPIIVDGLKPLPDLAFPSNPSSPAVPATESPPPDRPELGGTNPMPAHLSMPSEEKVSNVLGSNAASTPHASSNSSTAKKPLHLPLPPKPTSSGSLAPHLALRPDATPMRKTPFPNHPVGANSRSTGNSAIVPTSPSSNPGESNVPVIVEQPPEQDISTHSPIESQSRPAPQPIISGSLEQAPGSSRISRDISVNVDGEAIEKGLAASIHAPKAIFDSTSAPADPPFYAEGRAEPRNPNYTHTRAHTVGRPPSIPRSNHDNNQRFSRSGYSTPRGAFRGNGYHTRNHSSPPVGASGPRRPSQTQRPVINAEAISRLARTIGRPPNPPSVPTPGD